VKFGHDLIDRLLVRHRSEGRLPGLADPRLFEQGADVVAAHGSS
jgi:hypothetical protein